MKKISICVASWNDLEYLKILYKSIKNFTIFDKIRKMFKKLYFYVNVILLYKNINNCKYIIFPLCVSIYI